MSRRACILVLDGVGIGEAADADEYGDEGSHTLANTARSVGGFDLPNLQRAGLGNLASIAGLAIEPHPVAAHGVMEPKSCGKDSTAGHWELAGVHLAKPFPTYPQGFPQAVLDEFSARTGRPCIGNLVGSGTAMLDQFGAEHVRTGAWIIYTSADSVFQVAAHEQVVPLEELHAACARALLVPPHNVSRVIARPFVGRDGAWARTSNRRDFSVESPDETLLDALAAAGIPRTGVGKVDDLFARRGLEGGHTTSNAEGIVRIGDWLARGDGFCFANLVDFDQAFGHRNDAPGFYGALREFDAALPALLAALRQEDLLFVTADHGNDPTTASTDHARENVPVLVFGPRVLPVALGLRGTYSDVGASAADWMGRGFRGRGTSFLPALLG